MLLALLKWTDRWLLTSNINKLFMLFQFVALSQLYLILVITCIQVLDPSILEPNQFKVSRLVGAAMLLVSVFILILQPLLSKARPYVTEALLSLILLVMHLYLAYGIGLLAITTGFIAAMVVIVCISLTNRIYALFSVLFTVLGLAFLIGLSTQGLIAYAPLLSRDSLMAGNQSMPLILCFFLLLLPYIVLYSSILMGLKKLWRNREIQIKYYTTTDTLLNLNNRRAITDTLQAVIDRREQSKLAIGHLSVFICDLDNFKQVNDQYGHSTGDLVLIEVSKTLKESLREGDHIGRYGGEEFLVTLQDTDLAGAQVVAERCRMAIAEKSIAIDPTTEISITASFGLYSTDQLESIGKIIQQADQNLYQAKQNGRNAIVATQALLK